MIALDDRLKAVANELELGDKVADIGCDHGKIANSAVEITKNVAYAVDISPECLMKARTLSKELLQEESVVCLVGDGLEPVRDKDVNTVVIAGLGAHEIVKILNDSDKRYDKYILVPHQHADVLRQFLQENGFFVKKDGIVKSGNKFYPVIVAEGVGYTRYTPFEIFFGKDETADLVEFIGIRKKVLKMLSGRAKGDSLQKIVTEMEEIENYENQ